jgi:hypothetical protein
MCQGIEPTDASSELEWPRLQILVCIYYLVYILLKPVEEMDEVGKDGSKVHWKT